MALLARSRGGGRLGRTRAAVVLATVGTLMAFQALVATPAFAATSCTVTGGNTINVTSDATETLTFTVGPFGQIELNGVQTCGTGSFTGQTVSNTTLINITGDGDDQEVVVEDLADWGAVNWAINLNGGTADAFTVDNSTNPDVVNQEWGASGVDFNGDGDLDVTLVGVEVSTALAGDGGDTISAAGGTATGAAYPNAITITGGAGDDTLTGGAGDDTIDGATGDDTVAGGAGNDTLAGGAGTDTLDYSGSASAIVGTLNSLFTGEGVDSTSGFENLVGSPQGDTLSGDTGDNVITGGAGNDTLDGGAGDDTADYSDATAAVTVDLTAGTATGGAGNDTLSNFENVQGSDFDDTLTGDDGPNGLFGGSGNDTLAGMGGGDDLEGEGGIDTVDYSWSDPVDLELNCGATPGSEATNGDDIFTMENAILSTGDDSFVGNQFGNTVWPNGGQNTLAGDCVADTNPGGDVLNYSVGYDTGVEVNMAGGATAGDSAIGFENAIGTDFADTFVGNEQSNSLKGGGGADSIRAGAGDDSVRGGAGSDVVRGGSGDDDVFGGKGNDTLTGGSGDDLLVGGKGKDLCKGGAGSDTVRGCEGKSKARAETRARVARLARLG